MLRKHLGPAVCFLPRTSQASRSLVIATRGTDFQMGGYTSRNPGHEIQPLVRNPGLGPSQRRGHGSIWKLLKAVVRRGFEVVGMAQPLAGAHSGSSLGGWTKGPGMSLGFFKLQEFILNALYSSKTTQALGSTQMSNKSLSGTRCLPCWPQRTQGWPPALSSALTLRPCTSATRTSECSAGQF